MDSSVYSHLLDRTRVPQPELQRYAVVSLFQKLKDAPPPLGLASDHGLQVLSQCLRSTAPAAADQAVRELCRFARGGVISPSESLIELQSALEDSSPLLVGIFVKAIGFLCRLEFERDPKWGCQFDRVELHPFVKVMSCRDEVQFELVRQVTLFIVHNRRAGMEDVVKFLRPCLLYSIIRLPFLVSSSFAKDFFASVASLSSSLWPEAIPIIKLLMNCLMYFPNSKEEEFQFLASSAECLVDVVVVIMGQINANETLVKDIRACCLELLDRILSLHTSLSKHDRGTEIVLESSERLLSALKDCGWPYLPEFGLVIQHITFIFTHVELEHENISTLKILTLLFEWKTQYCYNDGGSYCCVNEELLYLLPLISLLSSPSKSVKTAASYLLSILEKHVADALVSAERNLGISAAVFSSTSKLEYIPFRLLSHLLSEMDQSLFPCNYLEFCFYHELGGTAGSSQQKEFVSQSLRYLSTVTRLKSSKLQGKFPSGISMLISSVVITLLVHPMLGTSAVDSLAALGQMDPVLGIPLLLAVLFYIKVLCRHEKSSPPMLLKLLELLPQLAIHSNMAPLIMQSLSPMIHVDAKPVLYAAAVRLFCKTWLATDRAFGILQGLLDSKAFSNFLSEREVCLSIAASVRDICRQNPDRGVDLILSVSSLAESQDSALQALGFESLAHLCEADVVDFYTAWDVIRTHVKDYSSDPIVANSLSILLRWGALDSEAYAETSQNIIQILWRIGTVTSSHSSSFWTKARASAFKSLSQYEVQNLQEAILDFKEQNFRYLVSENDSEVLRAMEDLQVKILNFEHMNRRRAIKEKKVMVHKVERLLDAFPRIMFPAGNQKISANELPGASLFNLFFTPNDFQKQGMAKGLPQLHAAYEDLLHEVSQSLHISRNIFFALLVVQSWKPFIERWLRTAAAIVENKVSSSAVDGGSKAANDVLKILCKVAMESIPRKAVNVALAIGALCMVLHPSAYATITSASEFLLKWLFEYGHEYQQWSAAISLGFIANCFQATDVTLRFEILSGLLKVSQDSKSHLVKGACSVGLGFASQGLFSRGEVDEPEVEGGTVRSRESALLGDILRTMSQLICKMCPDVISYLKNLNESFPLGLNEGHEDESSNSLQDSEDDLWGVAGIVLGLGHSVIALYRLGTCDAVIKIKDMLVSWVPNLDSSGSYTPVLNEQADLRLSIGACVTLPTVLAFCQRAELLDSNLDVLLACYCTMITELLKYKNSGTLYQNLLMTSCIGAGSLLSIIIGDGGKTLKFDDAKHLLEILREVYMQKNSPDVRFCAMIGIVNAFGADVGDLAQMYPHYNPQLVLFEQDASFIRGPILSNPICESITTSLIQDIYLFAKDSKDQQLRAYASWALSFLRHKWMSKRAQNANISQGHSSLAFSSHSVTEDTLAWKLSLWVKDINAQTSGEIAQARIVASVLRCLSKAPRLPALDWGGIIRHCMRYKVDSSDVFGKEEVYLLREECLHFSVAHAVSMGSLMLFLDELTDLPRFRMLEFNLQKSLLEHLPNLLRIFSFSRLEKLFDDLLEFFSSISPYLNFSTNQRSLLRLSVWKSLSNCLPEARQLPCAAKMEKCMGHLFNLLPLLDFKGTTRKEASCFEEEWSAAVRCLANSQQDWLMNLLEVPDIHAKLGGDHTGEVAKRVSAKARLVRMGRISFPELGKMKNYIFNPHSEDADACWSVLVEVVAALSTANFSIKWQWLIEALEISCVTDYPFSVLRFVGLLSGSCCKYMPLLIVDPVMVLSDLPVTLPSLLSDISWDSTAEYLVSMVWTCTDRLCRLTKRLADGSASPAQDVIRSTETEKLSFLARVMHQTCVSLKAYLPFEKQLKLSMLPVSLDPKLT